MVEASKNPSIGFRAIEFSRRDRIERLVPDRICRVLTMLGEERMSEETVNVRYMVDDVEAAIAWYTRHLGFTLLSNHAPAFADVQRGPLRFVAQRAAEFGRATHARRRTASARRLEPHPSDR